MTAVERLLAKDIAADEPDTWRVPVPLGDLREIVREVARLRKAAGGGLPDEVSVGARETFAAALRAYETLEVAG